MKKVIRTLALFIVVTVISGSFGFVEPFNASGANIFPAVAVDIVSGIVPAISEAGADGTAITDGNEGTVMVASNTGGSDYTCDVNVTWDLGSKKSFSSYDFSSWNSWYQGEIDAQNAGYQNYQANSAKNWTVQVSDDNENWTTIDTVVENLNAQIKRSLSQVAFGRYIKFNITKKCGLVDGGAAPWSQLVITEIKIFSDMPIASSVTTATAGQISNLVSGLTPTYTNHTPGDDAASPPTSALTDGVTSGDNTYAEWFCSNTGYNSSTDINVLFTWDLGKTCFINDYQLWLSSDTARAAKNFSFDVSSDGNTWTTADTVMDNALSYVHKTLNTPYVAKYVRFHFTKSSVTGFSWPALTIFEMKVNGAPGIKLPDINIVSGRVPTISEAGVDGTKITDGSEAAEVAASNTGGTDYSCDVSVSWDLGSKKTFSSYDFASWNSWYQSQIDAQVSGYKGYQAQSAKDWTVAVSDDNATWTTVDTVTGNLNAQVKRTFAVEAAGRYIRFHFTKKCDIVDGVAPGWAQLVITEIKIFGTPSMELVGNNVPTVSEAGVNSTLITDGSESAEAVASNTGGTDYSCDVTFSWDLGSKKNIESYDFASWNSWYQSQIDIQAPGYKSFQAQSAKDWTVAVSDDNANWTTVDTVVGNLNAKVLRTLAQGTSGRYIRFHFTKKCDIVDGVVPGWAQLVITEIKIYGTASETKQIVSGVTNGNTYFKKDGNLTIGFINDGTAKLNGNVFANGGIVNATGDYSLIVSDSYNNTNRVNFTYIMYGDVTGDGAISISDLLAVKKHVLSVKVLTGAYKTAGNIYSNGGDITPSDIVAVKKHLLHIGAISQNPQG